MGGANKAEFEELLRPHLAVAARLAFGLLQDRAEAEDAVQEAALKAWRRFETFRGGPFRPWFLGIVANQCRTVRRGRWWHVIRLAQPEATRPGPDLMTRADLRRALLELRPRQREALLMHFYLDLPLGEIATALGLTTAGVKSRINRGLRRLRPLLASEEEIHEPA